MATKYEIVHDLKKVKLIIGNGFDLHCKLDSSYTDYFNYNKEKNIYIKQWINDFKPKASDYCSYCHNHNDFWIKLNNPEKINIWDIYFNIRSNNFELWCNVEEELLNSLIGNEKNNSIPWKNVLAIINRKSSAFNDLTFVLAGYVMNKTNYQIISETRFYNFLLDELKIFESDFGNYVKRLLPHKNPFGVQTNYKYINNTRITIDELCTKQNIVSVSSFNYGMIADEELKHIFKNINGNLENPIFGVDSNLCGPGDPRYIFTKTCRRMTMDLYSNETIQESEFENVIIYGHSFSENDFSFFFPLLDKIEITNMMAKGKIVFAYSVYDEKKRDEILVKQRTGITNMFYEYARYKGLSDAFRLLDSISTLDRIILYEIKTID